MTGKHIVPSSKVTPRSRRLAAFEEFGRFKIKPPIENTQNSRFASPLDVGPLYMGPLYIGPLYIGPLYIGPLNKGPLYISTRAYAPPTPNWPAPNPLGDVK